MASGKITERSARALARLLSDNGSGNPSQSSGFLDSSFSRVRLAQAPEAGIPARTGTTLGTAQCKAVYYDTDGSITVDDREIKVLNSTGDIVGAGAEPEDRFVIVSKHSDGALVMASPAGDPGDPGDCDPCDPFWSTLDITNIDASDQVVIVRNGCVMLVDVDPCSTTGGPTPQPLRPGGGGDGLYEEFFH